MHTRIACRISVIKWIDSRMWLPIESMARNWTTYISRQSSNNRVQQLHFESVQKPHPAVTKKKLRSFLFFSYLFDCNFPSILNPKLYLGAYEIQFSRCPFKNIQKLNYSKCWKELRFAAAPFAWQFMQSTLLGLWLRVSLSLSSVLVLGFRLT